ncbi:MAG: ANTAR domain-containing protein [Lapillicoccus sp.]
MESTVDGDCARGKVVAVDGTLRLRLDEASMEVVRLREAMLRNRRIAAALGITMHQFDIDLDAAFRLLRRVSTDHNRKLLAVADDVLVQRRLPLELVPGRSPRG